MKSVRPLIKTHGRVGLKTIPWSFSGAGFSGVGSTTVNEAFVIVAFASGEALTVAAEPGGTTGFAAVGAAGLGEEPG